MKVNGKSINAPAEEIVVLLRTPENIILKAGVVLNYDLFNQLCPVPEPPIIMRKGGAKSVDVDDVVYNKNLLKWAQQKTDYMILQSLQSTDNIEWETVDINNPDTWHRYRKELISSGLTDPEIARIVEAVTTVCGLNQEKIDQATESFLAGQEALVSP